MITEFLDRPIAFHRAFVDLTGSITAALMLSQAVYWTKRSSSGDGWFWKVQEEWTEETGMTRYEQETARKKLNKFDFWKEEKRGIPAKLFYHVDFDKLDQALSANKYAGIPHTGMGESRKLDGGNPAGYYTESTTENTQRENDPSPLAEKPPAKDSAAGLTAPPVPRPQRKISDAEKYRRTLTAEMLTTLAKKGVEPEQFQKIVTAVLDVSGQTKLAGVNTVAGERVHNDAKECARTLIEMDYSNPQDVYNALAECPWETLHISQVPKWVSKAPAVQGGPEVIEGDYEDVMEKLYGSGE